MHRCEDVDCVPFQAANAVACLAEATVEGLFPFLDLPLCGAIN